MDVPVRWVGGNKCPACRIQGEARERHINVFLAWLADEEMRVAFDASPGLCVPHFLRTLRTAAKPDMRQYLIEIEHRKFAGLLSDLEEFCRKHDYRFSSETFGKEADSWRRVIQIMVGLPAIMAE